jgi:60 kDa SS-A/Ro ribonucleoprotein
MSSINHKNVIRTHEGGPACQVSPILQLRRTVLACLLWEKSFYESGEDAAKRIADLVPKCKPYEVADLAIEARSKYNLRHVPLLLVRELARVRNTGSMVSATLNTIIQRADELTEFVAIYWKDGKEPLANQVKKGLARAFRKFNEYHLAKYNRDGAVKLRDVLFLSHAKPADEEQAALWKRLANGELATPDTWEVALSAGADKKETFTRLIQENKLGYMALLRNLRNMLGSGVNVSLVRDAVLVGAAKSRALPFRFVAAARSCPAMEPVLDQAMALALEGAPRLKGSTVLLVDVSGSMDEALSSKSDLKRTDAAGALAALTREVCEEVRVFTFGNALHEVPARRGMALVDQVKARNEGTYLGQAVNALHLAGITYDRIIVITDEQTRDSVPAPKGKGYMLNVSTERNGIGYGQWTKIDGFSEASVNYIIESEAIDRSVS